MRFFVVLFRCMLLVIYTHTASAQNTFVKYLRTSKSSTGCMGRGLAEKSNGDFIVQFRYRDNSTQGVDFGYFFLDSWGDSIDTKTYQISGDDFTKDVIVLDENRIMTSGTFRAVGRSYYDVLLYEINFLDSTKNKYHYYDNFYGHFQGEILLEKNSSFYLLNSRTTSSTSVDFNLIKTNIDGMPDFETTYFTSPIDFVLGGNWDQKSNILMLGGSFTDSTAPRILVKSVETNGLERWQSYVGVNVDSSTAACSAYASGILQIGDGRIYLAGQTNNACEDNDERFVNKPLLICLDSNGNHLWSQKENIYPKKLHFFNEIYESPDGNLVCIGDVDLPTSDDFYTNTQVLVVKYDLDGNILWKRVHGENNFNEFFYNTIQTKDGGFLITGRYENIQNPTTDVRTFVMKLDACGCLVPGCDPNCNATGFVNVIANPKIELYPNPSQGTVQIKTDLNIKSYSVYSMLGSLMQEGFYNEQSLDVNYLPSGMYVIQFNMHDGSQQQHKFVRE